MKLEKLKDKELFSKLIKSKSENTYWKLICELRSRPNDFVYKKCTEFVESDKVKEKVAGIDVLAQLGIRERPYYRKTIELYFNLLEKETNEKVISSILFSFGHNNEKLNSKQLAKITSFKGNKNSEVRNGLVTSLLGLEEPLAIDTLIHLSNDKESLNRDWATFGLGTQIDVDNEKIRNALWNRINDSDQDTKLEAIVGLAKRKDAKVKEIIKRELQDGEYGSLLFEAIELLNLAEFIPLLKQNLETGKKEGVEQEWLMDLEKLIDDLENKNNTA